MKKEATPKNTEGLIKKELWWKKSQPQKCKGAQQKRPSRGKEAILKTKRAHQKDLRGKKWHMNKHTCLTKPVLLT
jgi:hypothetical protein